MLTATVLLAVVGCIFFAAFTGRNYMKGQPCLGPMLFTIGLLVALSRRLGAFDVTPTTRATPIFLVFSWLGVMICQPRPRPRTG